MNTKHTYIKDTNHTSFWCSEIPTSQKFTFLADTSVTLHCCYLIYDSQELLEKKRKIVPIRTTWMQVVFPNMFCKT